MGAAAAQSSPAPRFAPHHDLRGVDIVLVDDDLAKPIDPFNLVEEIAKIAAQ